MRQRVRNRARGGHRPGRLKPRLEDHEIRLRGL
jgi:hypothetical protein